MLKHSGGSIIVLFTLISGAQAQDPVIRCGDAASIEALRAEIKKSGSNAAFDILESRLNQFKDDTLRQEVCDREVQSIYESTKRPPFGPPAPGEEAALTPSAYLKSLTLRAVSLASALLPSSKEIARVNICW